MPKSKKQKVKFVDSPSSNFSADRESHLKEMALKKEERRQRADQNRNEQFVRKR